MPSPYRAKLAGLPVRERELIVDGAATRYWEYGNPDAPVTVLAIHGFRGDHHGLEPVIAQLRGVRIISPDLPGFGKSEPFRHHRHDITGYSDWLGKFTLALRLPNTPVVLGHSFGSIIASAAVARGLSCSQLILINPIAAPALRGPQRLLTLLAVGYYRAAGVLPGRAGRTLLGNAAIVRMMSEAMATTRDRRLRSWIHCQHDQFFSTFADTRMVLEAFEASIGSTVRDFAADISTPTLLICASQDQITSESDSRRLQSLFPNATLAMINNVGHLIHYERPREAAEHVLAFLGSGWLSEDAE